MKKIDFTEVVASEGDFPRVEPGGYVVRIAAVEDVASKEYLRIEYDIAEGDLAGHYSQDFFQTRPWMHSIIRSYKDSALGMFKGFYEHVEKSNPGFTWDGNNEQAFVGKLVGLLVGEEEYIDERSGEVKISTRATGTKPAQDIRDGNFRVPKLKELPASQKPEKIYPDAIADDGEELPF